MADIRVTLEDKYRLQSGRIFLTGTQALVRLPMMQRRRDEAAGLNTACFISGYRGSPLSGFDQQLWRARDFLKDDSIHFQPGVNEELAATAVWGTQQANLFDDCRYDGVYAMWYGKGPGVDRCADVFRHGNFSSASGHGGVLLLAGDDHAAKSSSTANQCEHAFIDTMIPVLHPAGVQEFLDLGIYGWALSRFSGCWVGFKTLTETVDTSASCYVNPHRIKIVTPEDFAGPPEGLNARWDGAFLSEVRRQEERLHRYKLPAAMAFARANNLDRIIVDSPRRRIGIITVGKSYLDLRQALDDLGISEDHARELGLSIYKVAMSWPLEPEGVRAFCEGLDEVLVVEEKRSVIESQLKEQLYNWPASRRPTVSGKFEIDGAAAGEGWQLPPFGELTPLQIAKAVVALLERHAAITDRIRERLARVEKGRQSGSLLDVPIKRIPHFCSGCPHNTSTRVPEGSRALAGIGCHWMVQWMGRNTATFTQMGGEGVTWVGQAPFSKTRHLFVNLGDGTYFHSGILAIRQAVAAGVNVTYKILFNDAVAMTGGQPIDGVLDPAMISRQIAAEGVGRIVVVTDDPDKYPSNAGWAPGVTIEHRDELDRVQVELREISGVTAIIYDQTCAAEKRRRRKRGVYPDPPKRVFINDLVCEGCGDCSEQSNCISVLPVETEFGTKRAIDQSNCNKDFSCLKGFCPSFVTVHGGSLRRAAPPEPSDAAPAREPPDPPALPDLEEPYNIVVAGIGGTGVLTVGAILGMAAHIEGKGCTVLDMPGLAQKGGAVISQLRIGRCPEELHAARIPAGSAKLLIGCDLVVAVMPETLAMLDKTNGQAVVDTHQTPTSDFTLNPRDYHFPENELRDALSQIMSEDACSFLDASASAERLLGDSIASNLFLLGYAWQKGMIPVRREAIGQAIEVNGVAVDFNKQAFTWGRLAAADPQRVREFGLPSGSGESSTEAKTLEEEINRRHDFLTDYQDQAYARRYQELVHRVMQAEAERCPGRNGLAEAVMFGAFKLMAYKDEYEVARLYSMPEFGQKLAQQFEGNFQLSLHLAPPLLARRDPVTGHLRKREFGAWIFPVLKVLARMKRLRGSWLDVFGYTAERRLERRLIDEYFGVVEEVCAKLTPANHALAVKLAQLPNAMKGFGHVKLANIKAAKAQEEELLATFRGIGDGPRLRQHDRSQDAPTEELNSA